MKDDVLALLSSPSPGAYNPQHTNQKPNRNSNLFTTPSLVSLASDQHTQDQYNLQKPSSTSFCDFDSKIRELEEQARQFKLQDAKKPDNPQQVIGKYKAVCFDTTQNENVMGNPLQTPQDNTSFSRLNVNTRCLTPNSAGLSDTRNEEKYLELIKQKLDMQLRETENLKLEMDRSKQPFNDFNCSGTSIYRATIGPTFCAPSVSSFSASNNGNGASSGLFDELIELRLKLKESYSVNEELKLTFRKNLSEMQVTLGECVEDRDKLLIKKDNAIKDLKDECQLLRHDLSQYQKVFDGNPSLEMLNIKNSNYEDLCSKLRQVLIEEEKKREKSYFVNGFSDHVANSNGNNELACKLIHKAILNCLQDYQGEIKHSRMIMKELQNAWETKESNLHNRESNLNNEFNKKCEIMKEEYDRILKIKADELSQIKEQLEDLTGQLNKEREKSRKKLDAKDLEYKSSQVKVENFQKDLANIQKELKQVKARLENAKSREKENLLNYEKTLSKLEKENEKSNCRYEQFIDENETLKKKIETVKCQITKYEQLIDSLNEQIILYKRDVKENELNHNQLCQNYETERETNTKLINKCQQLEKILHEHHQSLAKLQNLDKAHNDLQFKHEKMESILKTQTNESTRLQKELETNLSLNALQAKELAQLKEHSKSLENNLKECQSELNEVNVKFQNSSVFIHHSCKTNSLLKEEKESLEKILQDNACKLRNLKSDYDKIYEKYVMIENEYNNMSFENDLLNKKLAEMKNLNEIITNEKNEENKDSVKAKTDLNNLQASSKTLTRKLNSDLAEKDAKISQLEQTVSLYEKEIQLLKQSESLHKNQEESKVLEVVNTIQAKLVQKNSKIECLKTKLNSAETNAGKLNKENVYLENERLRLENQYNSVLTRNESLIQEIKKIETEFVQLRQKILHYELTMEKAAIKLTNSEKRNDQLAENLNKFKTLITAIVYSNENLKTTKPDENTLNDSKSAPQTFSMANADINSTVFTESLATFLISKLKENMNVNTIQTQLTENKEKDASQTSNLNESNEINILKFFNGLQQKLQTSEDKSVKKIQTSSTNDLAGSNSNTPMVLESSVYVDQASLAFDDISHVSCQESNKELCNRIETKLSHLNQIGLNLKKENNEANNLLLNNG